LVINGETRSIVDSRFRGNDESRNLSFPRKRESILCKNHSPVKYQRPEILFTHLPAIQDNPYETGYHLHGTLRDERSYHFGRKPEYRIIYFVEGQIIMKPTLSEIRQILIDNKECLRREYNVKDIGIFGSFIRNEQRSDSDLDVLVEFEEPIGLFKFMDLEDYLKNLLNVNIDLVSKKALKPNIGKHILEEVIYL